MDEPQTLAEASHWTKTSTYADVVAFLDKLEKLPHAGLLSREWIGKSSEGKKLPLVIAGKDRAGKLRIFVNANIHAGEVEGKEAVQILLREIALGKHAELLEHATLYFLPIYNPDGNDKIDKRNRASQNGPDGGVGTRAQADGYDLNRDFVKVDTPECRALLGAIQRIDPHVFMDLHTTNGSYHGFHLTYSPSLSTNVDPGLRDFVRKTFLPDVRAATKKNHGFRVYDYGNFKRRRPENGWATYDHRPRFGTNYFALRNRVAVLSEAYSYVAYADRVRVTRAFVLETIRTAIAHRADLEELCAAADAALTSGQRVAFGFDSELEPPWEDEVLVGSVTRKRIEGSGVRLIANPDYEAKRIPVQVAFVSKRSIALPRAWAIAKPSDAVIDRLRVHGVELERVANAREVTAEVFVPSEVRHARRPFQKHHEVRLTGKFVKRQVTLPEGAVVVTAKQRLARVAAQLLEAQSEDSLATWNLFDADLKQRGDETWPDYPVLRVID